MALKLNERYPGRFTNPSVDYPQGSFKNRSTPTAKDGSYLEKDWANDKEGFFQSLISSAGIVVNGLVDKVGASQYLDALVAVIKATSIPWSKVTNRPTTVSGYGITDAMPAAGGPFNPSFNGTRIASEAGGYNTIGGYQGWGSAGSGTYQFINNKGGGGTGGFLFGHSDASGNIANVMRFTPEGRLAVPAELVVPAIIGDTTAPTQALGYTGANIANCAYVVARIAASAPGASSEVTSGVIKIASQTQTDTGTDDSSAVTPKKLKLNFAASFAAIGYLRFPSWLGGLTIQWGTINGSNTTNSFPLVFANACLYLGGTVNVDSNSPSSDGERQVSAFVVSTSQYRIRNGTANGLSIKWLAVGY